MWMDSSVHRHEILSTTHNYFGAGVATDGRTIKWTVISITGPDRTDPVAQDHLGGAHRRLMPWFAGAARTHASWWAPRALRDYDLARRHPGGDMGHRPRRHDQDEHHLDRRPGGHRVSECARVTSAGNVGDWSAPVSAAPPPDRTRARRDTRPA